MVSQAVLSAWFLCSRHCPRRETCPSAGAPALWGSHFSAGGGRQKQRLHYGDQRMGGNGEGKAVGVQAGRVQPEIRSARLTLKLQAQGGEGELRKYLGKAGPGRGTVGGKALGVAGGALARRPMAEQGPRQRGKGGGQSGAGEGCWSLWGCLDRGVGSRQGDWGAEVPAPSLVAWTRGGVRSVARGPCGHHC